MTRRNDYIEKVDKVIGNRIYNLRLSKGLSSKELGETIGVTHQQLRKYEQGVNKISVGRLVLIAQALEKNIAFFYEDLNKNDSEETLTKHQRMCMEVSRNFMKINDPKHQEAICDLVKSLLKKSA